MEITVDSLVESFVDTKKIEQLSPKTTSWYHWHLMKFADWLTDKRLCKLTLDDARKFIAQLQARESRYVDHPVSPEKAGGLSAYSLSAYVRCLKVFSRWLMEDGYTKTDLFARLKRTKLPQPEITVLTEEEKRRIFDSINPRTCMGARTYAIMILLLDTGLRASELCDLLLKNVDFDTQRMKVLGKGNKERFVPFGVRVKKALVSYVSTFRPKDTQYDNVFLSEDDRPLTYNALKLLVARIAKRADVPRLHLHLARHSFAVSYLINGGDLGSLRDILGHEDITTTNKYLHLASQAVSDQHRKFSPMDNMDFPRKRGKQAA